MAIVCLPLTHENILVFKNNNKRTNDYLIPLRSSF